MSADGEKVILKLHYSLLRKPTCSSTGIDALFFKKEQSVLCNLVNCCHSFLSPSLSSVSELCNSEDYLFIGAFALWT